MFVMSSFQFGPMHKCDLKQELCAELKGSGAVK